MPYRISHLLVRAFLVISTPEFLMSKHSHKATNLSNLQQHNSQDATYNLRKLTMQTPPYILTIINST